MRQMSGQDAAFLYGETPNWHMHVSALMVLDPSTCPDGWSFDRFKQLLIERMPEAPQLRWKLRDVPFGLDRPYWIEDPNVDPDFHIRRIGVPSPGGPQELADLCGHLAGLKLDRSRPLWEAWVIEGLPDGRVALFQKLHHSIIDGSSGMGLAEILLDLQPEPRRPSGEVRQQIDTGSVPGDLEMLVRGAVNTCLHTPYRVARFTNQSIRQAIEMVPRVRGEDAAALPLSAPRTTLNADPTPHRAFATATVELERLKALKKAFDVKLNDVVLAICAGSLRRYLVKIDDLPEQPLLASVPVSLRPPGDDTVGNKVGNIFVSLATDVDDPAERLRAIYRSSQSAKGMREAMSAHQIMGITETAPPALVALAARMYTRRGLAKHTPPASNLVISNVPGPTFPLYVAGARLEKLYPMGPLMMGMSLNITVLSFMEDIDFGFVVSPESVPEPWLLAEGVGLALEELEQAAPSPPG
jgi:WS/DGAT/MGAT family acyltransferase